MKYYAIFSKVHGLKTIQAGSERLAVTEWRRNAGGARPDWSQWYPVKYHPDVRQMCRNGWVGTADMFAAALGDI